MADKVLDFEGAVNLSDYEGFRFNFEGGNDPYLEANKPGMKGADGNIATAMTGMGFQRADGQAFDLHSLDFGFTGGAVGVSAFAYTADGKWLQYYVDDMPANNMNHITLDWSNVVYAGISVNNDGTIEVSVDNIHIGSHDGLFV
ncbi:hypothetical protein FHX08_002086 [Rhizobium sp. BK529]|uniref:hypothetical protein n=1 Tax=Rhizobium sp. BK529 TaxID=2586983 RepID=UPI0017F74B8E|nr:hypothetical protein [Rhizobium sp. BK529]MBB3591742.1 hypothetical protein [Rhizobium sp. BK529]